MWLSVGATRSSCSVFLGACVVLGLAACSDNNSGQNSSAGPLGIGGVAPGTAAGGSAGVITGSSGAISGSGGFVSPPASNGGSPAVGGGITGAGGASIAAGGAGSAGTPSAGAAGDASTGTSGAAGLGGAAGAGVGGQVGAAGNAGASGGGAPGTTLGTCDSRMQSSAHPLDQACGTIIGPDGMTLKLGPYGAIMDRNVGTGFENTDPNDDATCPSFAALFAEPKNVTDQLLDVGTQPCNAAAPNPGTCVNFKLYTVYRPAIWPSGTIPVISWANGTCAQPEGYGTLLRYVASFGFFVVAANSREVGTGKEPLHALDFAAAATADQNSPYYGHLDLSKVGVMGHSQGGGATVAAAKDNRVKDVIIFNGGLSAVKPFLSISGDLDVTGYTAAQMASSVTSAPKGAYLYYHNPSGSPTDTARGHLVLMLTPQRVTTPTVAWWQMVLQDNPDAKNQFVGQSCGLCGASSDYAFGEHGL